MTRVGTGLSGVSIERLAVSAYEIPTDGPDDREADGTLTWDSTTMILVEAHAAGQVGVGFTYGDVSVAHFIESKLKSRVEGEDALQVGARWRAQMHGIRNAGRPGVGAMALSAVDLALWDLAARLLGVSLHRLVGGFHDHVPIYGSGGFCNYPLERLASQVGSWVEQGIPRSRSRPRAIRSRIQAGCARAGRRSAIVRR